MSKSPQTPTGAQAPKLQRAAAADRVVERFKLSRSLIGWHFLAADPESCPLLRLLVNGSEDAAAPIKKIPADPLADVLRRIGSVARRRGLGHRVCGNRLRSPTVLLWRSATPAHEPMAKVFSNVGAYVASWGLNDLYPDAHAQLEQALLSRAPIDTGWVGAKKEIQSMRVWRERRGARVHLSVRAQMDEAQDLADTAVWEVVGKMIEAGSGADALAKLGLTDAQVDETMERLTDDVCQTIGAEPSGEREVALSAAISMKGLLERVDELSDQCEADLTHDFEHVKQMAAEHVKRVREQQGASCANCKHFMSAMGATRRTPADDPECAHPRHGTLMSVNKAFPFERGCKFWIARGRR